MFKRHVNVNSVYTVPTDWTIIFNYKIGWDPGQITVESWVSEYEESDQIKILTAW